MNIHIDIKEANFWTRNQYVVAESYYGSLYGSGARILVAAWNADQSILNIVRPHPAQFMLATSGIEEVIRSRQPMEEGKGGASKSLRYNYVLMMALSMARHLNVEDACVKAEQLGGSRKLCHDHIVHAAQYLLAEVVMAGNQISHFDDPKAHGRTAYLNVADIPQELVTALNRMAEGNAIFTDLDVCKFINDALKRYYATPIWPVTEEVNANAVECGSSSKLTNENLVADDEDQKPSAFSYAEENTNELEYDDMSDYSSTSSPEPPLEKTDPAALDQFYLVRGRKLVQLFRFCPKCGNRLNEAQLTAVGTEAVVRFVCEKCRTKSPHIRRWESQRRVAHD